MKLHKIDAQKLNFRELNEKIDSAIADGIKDIDLSNVHGQYYIGRGITNKNVNIKINGIPGNDLGVFMGKEGNGPSIYLESDGQDNIGNTMNGGKIVVNGNAGNILGYGMRGGKIFIKGDVGQRAAIHMKSTQKFSPALIIGGCAGNFLGEYMAGGTVIVLGNSNNKNKKIVGSYLGTGMHGGTIYINEKNINLSNDIFCEDLNDKDCSFLKNSLDEFFSDLKLNIKIDYRNFTKILPKAVSPYKKMYVKMR